MRDIITDREKMRASASTRGRVGSRRPGATAAQISEAKA